MFPLVHLGVDFVTTDQVPPFGGGVALFDLVAIPSDPRIAVAEQFQRPIDNFVWSLVGAGAQRLGNEPLMFLSQNDGHSESSFFPTLPLDGTRGLLVHSLGLG